MFLANAEPIPGSSPTATPGPEPTPGAQLPKRFFGTVDIDADRAARDMGKVAEEVLQHLSVLLGAKLQVTVEISATVPDGVPEETERTVTENSRTLNFRNQGFEKQ